MPPARTLAFVIGHEWFRVLNTTGCPISQFTLKLNTTSSAHEPTLETLIVFFASGKSTSTDCDRENTYKYGQVKSRGLGAPTYGDDYS